MRHLSILVTTVLLLALVLGGCSSADPTASDEYQELEQQLSDAEQQLIDAEQRLSDAEQQLIDAEQRLSDATQDPAVLAATDGSSTARYDKASKIHEEIISLLHNPEAAGTEAEIADLLATHATDDALMDDEVFGSVNYRQGFYNTLYSGAADAEIEVFEDWLAEDGSQGGFLWMWHGTNAAGNPFSLTGISLTTHDEAGLISYELVTYPYTDEYVREAWLGAGT